MSYQIDKSKQVELMSMIRELIKQNVEQIKELKDHIDRQIKSLWDKTDTQIQEVEARVEIIEGKVNEQLKSFVSHNTIFEEKTDTRIRSVETQVQEVTHSVVANVEQNDRTVERVDEMNKTVKNLEIVNHEQSEKNYKIIQQVKGEIKDDLKKIERVMDSKMSIEMGESMESKMKDFKDECMVDMKNHNFKGGTTNRF